MRCQVFGRIIENVARNHAVAGSLFWMTAARTYDDFDGTTIYLTPPLIPSRDDMHNLKIVELVRKHTIDIAAFNTRHILN